MKAKSNSYVYGTCEYIALKIGAIANCIESNNSDWLITHTADVENMVKDTSPTGSGFNAGSSIDVDASKPDRLVFLTSYHHMNEAGFYDRWSEHKVIVTPSLAHSFNIRVTGRNRNDIKNYIWEVFYTWLSEEYTIQKPLNHNPV